jgi:hypothetical protein
MEISPQTNASYAVIMALELHAVVRKDAALPG